MSSNSMLSLGEKLAKKSSDDLELIERNNKNVLDLHRQNSMQLSDESLKLTQGAIAEQTRQTLDATRLLNQQIQDEISTTSTSIKWLLMKPLFISMALVGGMLLMSWGMIAFISNQIQQKYQELDMAYQQLEVIQGVKVSRSSDQSTLWLELKNPKLVAGSYKDQNTGNIMIWVEQKKTEKEKK